MSSRRRQIARGHNLNLRPAALLVVAGLEVACSVPPVSPVHDLKLLHVDVVEPSQIPKQDKFWDYKTPLVRVEFSSMTDFQNVANTWVYWIGNRVSPCADKSIDEKRLIEGYPDVFDQTASVYTYDKRKTSRTSRDTSAPIIYHIYFAPQQSVRGWRTYDLVRNPADVCFAVVGFGERLPIGFRSNTVVISRQMLIDALERAGLK